MQRKGETTIEMRGMPSENAMRNGLGGWGDTLDG